jgi:hypothetical protein
VRTKHAVLLLDDFAEVTVGLVGHHTRLELHPGKGWMMLRKVVVTVADYLCHRSIFDRGLVEVDQVQVVEHSFLAMVEELVGPWMVAAFESSWTRLTFLVASWCFEFPLG